MTGSNNSDRNILPDVGEDPIAAAEALLEEFGGARKQLYQCIAKAVAIAEVLEADKQKWETFNAHVARKGLQVCKLPLRGVMCFLFTAKTSTGPAYDRACCYTRAVQQLRKDEAASAANIAKLIRDRGGVEELYAEAKAARAAEKEGNSTGRDGVSTNDDKNPAEPSDGSAGEAGDESQAETTAMTNRTGLSNGGKKDPPKKGATECPGEPRKYTKAWCERRLIFEISPTKLQDVLNMRHRQRGSLDFAKCGTDDDGFKIYNAENVRIN